MEKLLGMTPPMGWNSWNTFGWKINEDLIKGVADVFVESGLKDAGYEYIVIDDCWSRKQRDENGRLVPDADKFPSGMKALADYIHSKGLKMGMYSCAGTHTCGGFPGSFEHEFIDAQTFAEWDVDYLKYDYCYKPDHIPGEVLYKRMGLALKNCGRDILFSACNWGNDNVEKWIRESSAHIFRSTGDIQDNWESVKNIAYSQIGKECYSAPFCYNDIDMLVVGMYGKGDNEAVAIGGMNDVEYKTHFSLWAIMNSPLMIGCDVRKMSERTKEILTNKGVIEINQDIEGRGAYCIKQWNNPENVMSLIKPLANGDYAIGMFNFSDKTSEMSLQFWDLGISSAQGYGLQMYECWTDKDEGVFSERYCVNIESHDCRMFRAKLVKLK